MLRGAALLADEKLKLILGVIDKLDFFDTFLHNYRADFSPEMKALIYVVNLERSVVVEAQGVEFILIPLLQGVPWNEVIDERSQLATEEVREGWGAV